MGVIREPQQVSTWVSGTRSSDLALEIARQAGLGNELQLIRGNSPLRDTSVFVGTLDRSAGFIVEQTFMQSVPDGRLVFSGRYNVTLGPGVDASSVRRAGEKLHKDYLNSPMGRIRSFLGIF